MPVLFVHQSKPLQKCLHFYCPFLHLLLKAIQEVLFTVPYVDLCGMKIKSLWFLDVWLFPLKGAADNYVATLFWTAEL